jgi:hypothetical protein
MQIVKLKKQIIALKRSKPITKKPWKSLGATGRSARRRRARKLIKELDTLFEGSVIELAKNVSEKTTYCIWLKLPLMVFLLMISVP